MKTIYKISMSLLIAALSLLTACEISTGAGEDGFGYEPKDLTVTFDSNGGTPVSSITGVKLYSTISKPTNPKTGYKFEGWYLNGKEWDFAIDVVIGNITLYAKWGDDFDGSFVLGETGPGGGTIFYVADGESGRQLGFIMTDTGKKCYYLEAAPNDMPTTLIWQSAHNMIASWDRDIGTGRKNTALIVANSYGDTTPAATDCDNYSNNDKTDWFLPSRDELNELYKYNVSSGDLGLNDWYYWSSTADPTPQPPMYEYELAYARDFSNGSQTSSIKTINNYCVRAIRAF